MHAEIHTSKGKPQRPVNSIGSHLSTYQGEIIRKSICNDLRKDKNSQRMHTQNSQKCSSIGYDMKKIIKEFRMPFKSTSPNMKKKEITAVSAKFMQHKKLSAQIKPSPSVKNTEVGPIIKKASHKKVANDKEKHQKKCTNLIKDFKEEKGARVQMRKTKVSMNKKLGQCRSMDRLHHQKSKNHGTFDSTPKNLMEGDIQHLMMIGQGTFGKVFKSSIKKTGQIVAVKKVFQDPKYKNREVEIVSMLDGDFTMKVIGTYNTAEQDGQYLNIVMDYYDCDLYSFIKTSKKGISVLDIKIFTYQIFRGLMYIHSLNICHRDIKPHNLLIRGKRLVLCDFGSAKILTNEPNLPYICSRCYRAPELIFGASHYTPMIDIWSVGCVILQILNGTPLFIGDNSIDHLIQIIKVMGTPTKTQVIEMNPDYDLNDYKFPKVKKRQWKQVFAKADPLLLDLICQIMIYSPKQRLNAAEALTHEFFDEIREQKIGRALQKELNVNLFDFSYGQTRGNQHLLPKLVPPWVNSN